MAMFWMLYTELLFRPLTAILVALYHVFAYLGIPSPLGFSIIGLTIVIRLILYPIMHSQVKTTQKMQSLSPHLNKLKETHKGDNMRLQQETMKLYKEHGVNPAAGCITAIVQLPILIALYSVLQQVVALHAKDVVSHVNKLTYDVSWLKLTHAWDPLFFGIPLSQNPQQLMASMPLILLVPLITAVLQYYQSAMMFPKVEKPIDPKTGLPTKTSQDDFAAAFQTQAKYLFPIMLGYLSFTFPIGLSLYWNTFTLFGILQQYHAQHGFVPVPPNASIPYGKSSKKTSKK